MGTTDLTACLIVRDEAARLAACVASLRACAAVVEICVLDTGSRDDTIAIARAHGARVEEWPWRDDFAAARNRAVAMARTPWVLVVDADERLHVDGAALRRTLAGVGDAVLLAVEVDDVRQGRLVSTSPSIRIFRRDRVHYVGRVHETPQVRPGHAGRGLRLDRAVARIEHIGYDSTEALERRRVRNLALADREVEAARTQGAISEALVAALVNRGRAAATGSGGLRDGLDDWLEAWSCDVDTPFRLWAGELAAVALIEAGRVGEVALILRSLHEAGADEANLTWLGAQALIAQDRHEQALPLLRRAEGRRTAMGERPSDDSVLGARLRAELATNDLLGAATTAARLMVDHGETGGVLDVFLMLTDGAPTAAATLIEGACEGRAEGVPTGVVKALEGAGEAGSAIATRLQGRFSR